MTMTSEEIIRLSASEMARRIAAGDLTSEAVTRACLDRIEARDGALKAWVHLDPDDALAQARTRDKEARDGETPRGPLHGVPVGIKDIIDTAGLPTEKGSPIWRDHQPVADAVCVSQLRRAGAVILGKTATTEFAALAPAATANPHNPEHTPGGSSSGSAAGVADFHVPLALGTQTMGSIIRPAAFCGVVGYKPSFGTVPRSGVFELCDHLDTIGLLARTPNDLPVALAALTGTPTATFEAPNDAPPRIAVIKSPAWDEADPPTKALLHAAAKTLKDAGATVTEIEAPDVLHQAMDAHWAVAVYEISRALSWEWDTHRDEISPKMRGLIEEGLTVPRERYLRALETAQMARDWSREAFGAIDVLLTPSAPGEAPHGLQSTGSPAFNRLWTLLHLPCATLPAGTGPEGLPLGVQLVGAQRQDAELIASACWVAARLEQA